MPQATPPFSLSDQLNDELADSPIGTSETLPGRPLLKVTINCSALFNFLNADLRTPDLDTLAPHMWLLTSQSSTNISPLHHQSIKGRKICITEDPGLHLVWIDDRVFIKPVPVYLLSHAFWARVLLPETSLSSKSSDPALSKDWDNERDALRRAALGFLRTYFHLIQHPSDLDVAITSRLVPENIKFEAFCRFYSEFTSILDSDVSPRYAFGELRLTRLNFWSKIFLWRWNYQDIPHQYSQYFQRFYGPLLFAFGCVSIMLSALQVEMAVESLTERQWQGFWSFSRVFSVLSFGFAGFCGISIISLLCRKLLVELLFAVNDRTRLKIASTIQNNRKHP